MAVFRTRCKAASTPALPSAPASTGCETRASTGIGQLVDRPGSPSSLARRRTGVAQRRASASHDPGLSVEPREDDEGAKSRRTARNCQGGHRSRGFALRRHMCKAGRSLKAGRSEAHGERNRTHGHAAQAHGSVRREDGPRCRLRPCDLLSRTSPSRTSMVRAGRDLRGPEGISGTAMFIGGKRAIEALDMMDRAKKAMVPPFEIFGIRRPAGSFTTAAAMVACAKVAPRKILLDLKGMRVVVSGGTGVVAFASAVIAVSDGAKATLVGYDGGARQKPALEVNARFDEALDYADGSTEDRRRRSRARPISFCCRSRAQIARRRPAQGGDEAQGGGRRECRAAVRHRRRRRQRQRQADLKEPTRSALERSPSATSSTRPSSACSK